MPFLLKLEAEFWMTEGKGLTLTSINLGGLDALLEFSVLFLACIHRNDYEVEVSQESNP